MMCWAVMQISLQGTGRAGVPSQCLGGCCPCPSQHSEPMQRPRERYMLLDHSACSCTVIDKLAMNC